MRAILENLRQRGSFTYDQRQSFRMDRTIKALVRRGLVNVNPVYASDNWRVTLVAEQVTPAGRQALAPDAPRQVTNWLDPETGQPVGGMEAKAIYPDGTSKPIDIQPTEPTREELIAALSDVLGIAVNCCGLVQMKISELNTLAEAQMLLARCK